MILFRRPLVLVFTSCFFFLLTFMDASARTAPGTSSAAPASRSTATTVLRGRASWYGSYFQGRRTTSGERFNRFKYTCAHKTLPFGTRLRVTNVKNGKSVVVRVTDRGPFRHQRILDLSEAAAKPLGVVNCGAATVIAEVVAQDAPLGPATTPENFAALYSADPHPEAAFTTYSVAPEAPISPLDMVARVAGTAKLFAAAADTAAQGTATTEPGTSPAGFFIQAGSFDDAANATSVQTRIKALFPEINVNVSQDLVDGRQRSRVLVGQFGERPEAEAMRRQLLVWGIGGMVREVALR
jgi:rare lipoprotein A